MDWASFGLASLGGVCMGTYPLFVKTAAVCAVRAHPLVFQGYKSAWVAIVGAILVSVRGSQGAAFVFSWWGVAAAAAWVPAGFSLIAAVSRIGMGAAVLVFDGTAALVSFLVFWLVGSLPSTLGARVPRGLIHCCHAITKYSVALLLQCNRVGCATLLQFVPPRATRAYTPNVSFDIIIYPIPLSIPNELAIHVMPPWRPVPIYLTTRHSNPNLTQPRPPHQVFHEPIRVHLAADGSTYVLAPAYLLLSMGGMAGLVCLPRCFNQVLMGREVWTGRVMRKGTVLGRGRREGKGWDEMGGDRGG